MAEAPRTASSKVLEALGGAAGLGILNVVLFLLVWLLSEQPGEIPREWVVAGLYGCVQGLWVIPLAVVLAFLRRGWAILGVAITATVTFALASAWMLVVVAMAGGM